MDAIDTARQQGIDINQAVNYIRNLERKDADSVPIFAMTANAFVDDISRKKRRV